MMNLTFYYTYLITIQYYEDNTMGSERQWLPHDHYKKKSNIKVHKTTLPTIKTNGYYTISYHTIPYYTIIYYTISYHTIL